MSMRYFIEADIAAGVREEHWADSEEAALAIVRRFLQERVTVTFSQAPVEDALLADALSPGGPPFERTGAFPA